MKVIRFVCSGNYDDGSGTSKLYYVFLGVLVLLLIVFYVAMWTYKSEVSFRKGERSSISSQSYQVAIVQFDVHLCVICVTVLHCSL